MAKKFRDLYNKLPAEDREEIEVWVHQELVRMSLTELRQSRGITQERLAEMLGVSQATISKMERQSDMYLSTVARLVSALGGTLKLAIDIPGQDPILLDGLIAQPDTEIRSTKPTGREKRAKGTVRRAGKKTVKR